MRKVAIGIALVVLGFNAGCSWIGEALGVDFCPVWTPLKWIAGQLGG